MIDALDAFNIDTSFTTTITPEDYMNNTGIVDFLADNDVNTSFVDDLPSFDISFDNLIDIFIEN